MPASTVIYDMHVSTWGPAGAVQVKAGAYQCCGYCISSHSWQPCFGDARYHCWV